MAKESEGKGERTHVSLISMYVHICMYVCIYMEKTKALF